jgi:phenylpropionate dioxygenase-like ring-hydroxylating dioxygenase large terminal subunit
VPSLSNTLEEKPLARSLHGTPLELFRDASGTPHALLERSTHRNVPLSLGRVSHGRLECAYHGWQFDGTGHCRNVPGLLSSLGDEWCTDSFPTLEQEGLVWVYATAGEMPNTVPFSLGPAPSGYAEVLRDVEVKATLHATLENALDVPHTAFLHRGLFRGGRQNEISAVVRRYRDKVEIEYQGEPRPPGVVGRILSRSQGTVEHFDRFFLPSIAQVEYRLGPENHFVVTSFCTPLSDFHTAQFAVARFKTRFVPELVRHVLEPFAMRIFHQDAAMLQEQSNNVQRFGGEQFISTEIDMMGPQIWRLLKQAERGDEPPDGPPAEHQVKFRA